MKLRKFLGLLTALALCLGLMTVTAWASAGTGGIVTASTVGDFTVTGDASGYTYDETTHVLTVHTGANITISGTTTTDHIVVAGNANITLSNVDIQFSDSGADVFRDEDESRAGICALWIDEGANLTLTLAGENTLKSGAGRAGINVSETAALTIQGDGTLNATGGTGAAGIGGGTWNNAGCITINSGMINATGTNDGAGIGGGHANDALDQIYGGFERIEINGGVVTAISTRNGAGIGTGCWSKQGGSIAINGGIVTAEATQGNQNYNAAIGQGYHGSSSADAVSVTIQNSLVTVINRNGEPIATGGGEADITNSLVTTTTGGRGAVMLYGSYTLTDDFDADGLTLVIPNGSTLVVPEGVTLTIGRLIVQGTLNNQGTIEGEILDVSGLAGSGTAEDPYLISDLETLEFYRDLINDSATNIGFGDRYYRLTADIDLNPDDSYDPATGTWTVSGGEQSTPLVSWEPIGTYYNEFTGSFDGNGHRIFDLYINSEDEDQGLFGYVGEGGAVQNITVIGDITGEYDVGGVVGENYGSITGCSFAGSVTGYEYVGGIVGYNDGDITGCHNTGSITGDWGVGGIVGDNDDGNVTNCSNTGSVTGDAYVGGIAGDNDGDITDSYNTGAVEAAGEDAYVGGITGDNDGGGITGSYNTGTVEATGDYAYVGGIAGDNDGAIANCYNTGAVEATGDYACAGGIAGDNDGGSITDSYNTGTVEATVDYAYAGGIAGNNDGAIANCYNTGSVVTAGDDSYAGGVVGYHDEDDGIIANCYYAQAEGLTGVGNDDDNAGAIAKTTEEFASGQVAWLLQNWRNEHRPEGEDGQVWGQTLTGNSRDAFPVLTSETAKSVIKVEFQDGGTVIQTAYTNPNGTVTPPEITASAPAGQVYGWFDANGTRYTDTTPIPSDMVLNLALAYAAPQGVHGDVNQITGVNSTMEYSADGGVTWNEITGTAVIGLRPGKYQVRVKASADGSILASESVTVTVTALVIPPVTDPSYAVTVAPATNGTVTVNPANAQAGVVVTITASPNPGYEVGDVTVTDQNGSPVAVTGNGDGTYSFTQPTGGVTVAVTFRAEEPGPMPFTDVSQGVWYYDAVEYVYENGLMEGTGGTLFSPDGTTTRAQVVTILWRLEGSPVVNYAMDYSDVAEGLWYSEAVRWASSEGIVNGVGGNAFAPDDLVTREQFAAILYRYAHYKGYDVTAQGDLSQFTDGDTVSVWAADAMTWAVGEGLIIGSAQQVNPSGSATRAETAQILMRFMVSVED